MVIRPSNELSLGGFGHQGVGRCHLLNSLLVGFGLLHQTREIARVEEDSHYQQPNRPYNSARQEGEVVEKDQGRQEDQADPDPGS
jgi:hypothetical protein